MRNLGTGDFSSAWGGVSGLQSSLQVTWDAGHHRGVNVTQLAQWWSEAPARLAGLSDYKGSIERAKDADFVVMHVGVSCQI